MLFLITIHAIWERFVSLLRESIYVDFIRLPYSTKAPILHDRLLRTVPTSRIIQRSIQSVQRSWEGTVPAFIWSCKTEAFKVQKLERNSKIRMLTKILLASVPRHYIFKFRASMAVQRLQKNWCLYVKISRMFWITKFWAKLRKATLWIF
jgi:hypothetical protein